MSRNPRNRTRYRLYLRVGKRSFPVHCQAIIGRDLASRCKFLLQQFLLMPDVTHEAAAEWAFVARREVEAAGLKPGAARVVICSVKGGE